MPPKRRKQSQPRRIVKARTEDAIDIDCSEEDQTETREVQRTALRIPKREEATLRGEYFLISTYNLPQVAEAAEAELYFQPDAPSNANFAIRGPETGKLLLEFGFSKLSGHQKPFGEQEARAIARLFQSGTAAVSVSRRNPSILKLSLYILKSLVDQPDADFLPVLPRKRIYRDCRILIYILFPEIPILLGDANGGGKPSSAFHPSVLYDDVHAPRVRLPDGQVLPTPQALIPTLRPYQQAAVKWMIEREQDMDVGVWRLEDIKIWFPLEPAAGQSIADARAFFNPFTGAFRSYDPGAPSSLVINKVRGGILADEMGLGKTVEVLACVLGNQWQASEDDGRALSVFSGTNGTKTEIESSEDTFCICGLAVEVGDQVIACTSCGLRQHAECCSLNGEAAHVANFKCVYCLSRDGASACGTTLIVTPMAIFEQWMHEISRHTTPGSIKIAVRKAPFPS